MSGALGSIGGGGFSSGFTGSLNAVSGAIGRAQELSQRQAAADAQELQNQLNRPFVTELDDNIFAEIGQRTRRPEGQQVPTGGVQAPSVAGTPPAAPQAPTAGGAATPPAAPQAPAPSAAPQAPPGPTAGAPAGGGEGAPQPGGRGQPSAEMAARIEGAQQGRQTAMRLAQALGKPVDQLTQADWRMYTQTAEEIAQRHPNSPMAREAVEQSVRNRALALSQGSALVVAALESGDLNGAARGFNALNGHTASGYRDTMAVDGNNIVITRQPENGEGRPETVRMTREQARDRAMHMIDPKFWYGHLEAMRHNRVQEGIAQGQLGVARGSLDLANRRFGNEVDTQGRERELQGAAAAVERLRAVQNPTPEQAQQLAQAEAALETARGRNQHVPVNATLDQQEQQRGRAAEQRLGQARTALDRARQSGTPEQVAQAERAVAEATNALSIVQREQAAATERAGDINRRQQESHTAASGQGAAAMELAQAEAEYARNPTPENLARVQAARQMARTAASQPGSTVSGSTATLAASDRAADQGQQEADRANTQAYLQLRNQVLANPDNEALTQELANLRSRLSVNDLNRLSQVDSRELQDGVRQEQVRLQRDRLELQRANEASMAERRLAQTEHDRATRAGNTALAQAALRRIETADRAIEQRASQFALREQRLAQRDAAINPQRARDLSEAMATGMPADTGSPQQREFTNTAHAFAGPLVMLNRGMDTAELQRAALQWLQRNPQTGAPQAAAPATPGMIGRAGEAVGNASPTPWTQTNRPGVSIGGFRQSQPAQPGPGSPMVPPIPRRIQDDEMRR